MKMIKYLFLLFAVLVYSQERTVEFSVYFDTDSSVLNQQAMFKIDKLLVFDNEIEIYNVSLSGYCDDRGSDVYNKKLAWDRIESVGKYINPILNYSTAMMNPIGELPILKSKNIDDQRDENRRVDVVFSYKDKLVINVTPEPVIEDTIEQYRAYDILKDSLKIGDKIVFNNVIFYPGRHKLRPSSFPVMDSIINSLLLHKKYEIEIQGHICCLKPGIYGRDMETGQLNLSQARAEQVKRFLVKYGVAADRLTTIGKQSNFKTGKGDFYDRRVEIHITGIREEEVKK